MIFVTVGSWERGFDRLIMAVWGSWQSGAFGEKTVVVQSRSVPQGLPDSWVTRTFLAPDEFREAMERADLVITHGGSTVVGAARMGKMAVAMPRRRRFGECANDHQVGFVNELAKRGLVLAVNDERELLEAVPKAMNCRPAPLPTGRGPAAVQEALRELVAEKKGAR